jgi:hypothetical protein
MLVKKHLSRKASGAGRSRWETAYKTGAPLGKGARFQTTEIPSVPMAGGEV